MGSSSRTLLEMTSEILTSMQSDEVTSITDTAESTAVANCIRRSYLDLFGLEELPENYTAFRLTATSAASPTLMKIPTDSFNVEWVKYNIETADNTDDQFVKMDYVPYEQFLETQDRLVESASTVSSYSYTFGTDPIKVMYINNAHPRCYTSPDDFNLIFDSIDTSVDTFLTAAKTKAWGLVDSTFTFVDGFTPDLDASQMSMLFNVAKSQAFVELKQTGNATAESRARRLMIKAQKTRNRTPKVSPLDRLPNYGRH